MKEAFSQAPLKFEHAQKDGVFVLKLTGRLSSKTAGMIWAQSFRLLRENKPKRFTLDASGLDYCDMTGIGFINELKVFQSSIGGGFQMTGLGPDYESLMDLAAPVSQSNSAQKRTARGSWVENFGKAAVNFTADIREQIAFIGEMVYRLCRSALKPGQIRWKDVWIFVEKGGVNAAPLIIMAGFLIGVIMAFQSAVPLKQMGSDVFVANVVAFAVLRELGPLMTAIILAGRTGSAIAAEIGTMKINEEVNALTTMGLEPVQFLVVSRMIGILFLAPLLTIISDFFGMLGGAVVFSSFGYSVVTYMNQITSTVDLGDVLGGIFKSIPFALTVGGIGCMRGLQTKTGATAVGESTTSSVVTGMILIIILDGVISGIYYLLGI